MALKIRGFNSIIAGVDGALNFEDGGTLEIGEVGLVIKDKMIFPYQLTGSGAGASYPGVIAPLTNPGAKRWEMMTLIQAGDTFSTTVPTTEAPTTEGPTPAPTTPGPTTVPPTTGVPTTGAGTTLAPTTQAPTTPAPTTEPPTTEPPTTEPPTQTFNSTNADGYIGHWGNGYASWANIRAYPEPESWMYTEVVNYSAESATSAVEAENRADTARDIVRSYLYFDTSGLADGATISAASLFIYVTAVNACNIIACAGSQSDTLIAGDWASYGAAWSDSISVSATGWLEIPLNATALANISKTGTTKIVLLEYTHDYLNVEPSIDQTCSIGINFGNNATNKPYLAVTV